MKTKLKMNSGPFRSAQPCQRENGFTLIEVMIAIGVLAFGILAIASMQVTAIDGNKNASEITESTALAQDFLEELMCLTYDDASLSDVNADGAAGLRHPLPPPPAPAIPDPGTYPSDYQIPNGDYIIYWNISEDDPIPSTKRISVTVTSQVQGAGLRKATQLMNIKSNW
jgi:type IV pilus assembly protein PilV